jgi:hypothetical protein
MNLSSLPVMQAHLERVKATEVMQRILAQEARYVAELESDGSKIPPHIRAQMAV